MGGEITCEICGMPVRKRRFYRYGELTLILCEKCARSVGAIEVERKKVYRRATERLGYKRRSTEKPPEELSYEIIRGYGAKIRQARLKIGIDRAELARRIGVSESVLAKIENERLAPDIPTAKKLERILGISIVRRIDLDLLEKISGGVMEEGKPLTIGDIIVIEKPKKRRREKR